MIDEFRHGDATSVGISTERLGVARDVALRWVESGETTGLVVLFARRGIVVWEEAFGLLTPALDAPLMTPDALFPLASVAKPIMAAAMMCLVEDGLIGLNRPLREYLPEFLGDGKGDVTLLHLLTHTSGIDDGAVARHVAAAYPGGSDMTHRIAVTCAEPLGALPGTRWIYSSSAYDLVVAVIERVSGQPFQAFLHERLFVPIGMVDTYVGLASAPPERVARRYPPTPPPKGYAATQETVASAHPYGVMATARDTARFGNLFLTRGGANGTRVLAPATIDTMMRNHVSGLGLQFDDEVWPAVSWGIGWHIRGDAMPRRGASLGSPRTIDHQGTGGAHLWVDPEVGMVGVVLPLLRAGAAGFYPGWRSDLLANAVLAALES